MKIPKVETRGTNFRVRWTDINGDRQSESFLKREDAAMFAAQKALDIENVKRGLRGLIVEKKSFGDLCTAYLTVEGVHKRSLKYDNSMIKNHLLPYYAKTDLRNIAATIGEYRKSKSNLAPKTVHNQLTLLATLLNFAVRQGWLHQAPRIKKPPIKINSRDYPYLKTESERRNFLEAAKTEGPGIYSLYATAIYTGMRAGELAGLRWDCVDFKNKLIKVKCSYLGPTKNGEIRYVPILDVLFPIIVAWKEINPLPFVFISGKGTQLRESSRAFQEIFHRVLRKAELVEKNTRGGNYMTFHGLRHTFASCWSEQNGDRYKLQTILGHKSPALTDRYSHLRPEAYESEYGIFGAPTALNPESSNPTLEIFDPK